MRDWPTSWRTLFARSDRLAARYESLERLHHRLVKTERGARRVGRRIMVLARRTAAKWRANDREFREEIQRVRAESDRAILGKILETTLGLPEGVRVVFDA